MIRKFLHRLLSKKKNTSKAAEIIAANIHGIDVHALSHASRKTVETLQKHGYQAFIVGGAVRDLIAGLQPKDFDVATNATPEEVKQCFRRAHIIGRRFRIVHVYHGHEIIEVTTFRGNHADDGHKDEHGRILRDNVFGTQAEDALRRDFTVNALYYDPTTQTVIDYHEGVADLKHKVLRMIGEPTERYREDPIRMLRAIRLSTRLGLSIDPSTKAPMQLMQPLLKNVPVARLLDEVLKLLTCGAAVQCVIKLREEGLNREVLPGLSIILEQSSAEHFIQLALHKTDQRVAEGKSVSPSFLFAALLWQKVLEQWRHIEATGEKTTIALAQAIKEVLEQQSGKLGITRRIINDMKEIWALQVRFLVRSGKKPWLLLNHLRFRASYDFLLLRAEVKEDTPGIVELAHWWTRFLQAGHEEREQMLSVQPSEPKKKRRRRKRADANSIKSDV